MPKVVQIPFVIRGRVIKDKDVDFETSEKTIKFITPNIRKYVNDLTIEDPSDMEDLYQLKLSEILDYLCELGKLLKLENNEYLNDALHSAAITTGLTKSVLRNHYNNIASMFDPQLVLQMVERLIGTDYLEGWVTQKPVLKSPLTVSLRAFGARCLHIIAGNAPGISAISIIRNMVTRSDGIVKIPSNDLLTAAAIAQTMVEMSPDHPLTRHLCVAYWKGGDEQVENRLYDANKIEKVIAWGGNESIKHIKQHLGPGIDLITLDPKLSCSIIGKEGLKNNEMLNTVAKLLASDIGALNQEACFNSRIIFLECGTDESGLHLANELGKLTFQALVNLPDEISEPHKMVNMELQDEISAVKLASNDVNVFDGMGNEGAILVSQYDSPVDFAHLLSSRVANIVPVDNLDVAYSSLNSYSQTIGVYPNTLKNAIRDKLGIQGGQRLVSLGYAATSVHDCTPQDGIEVLRRMCKWVVDETADCTS